MGFMHQIKRLMQMVRMKYRYTALAVSILSFLCCGCSSGSGFTAEDYARADAYLQQSSEEAYKPVKKANGGKFRIGYVDIDPYPPSGEMLYYLIGQLQEKGWITLQEKLPFDPQNTDAKELILYLAERDVGEYLEFSPDACYYLSVEGEETCAKSLKKHEQEGDLDLILCMGTWPGRFVKELEITDIPVMVYFCVDPVGAGLSASSEYSGQDNLWCHVNYMVYNMQLKYYHDCFHFNNIGMVYYDETVAAMPAYREAAAAGAEKDNFRITEIKVDKLEGAGKGEADQYYDALSKAYQRLVEEEQIDAFMLGTDMIKDEKRIRGLLSVFYQNGIPVFVQNGEYFVKQGAFMMITASDAKDQAPFAADVFSAILNGRKPGSIPQEYMSPPYLCLNLDAADRTGIDADRIAQLILSAEKIYGGEGND